MESSKDSTKKRYRPNVAAILMSRNYPLLCEFFLAERSDLKGMWQFPQGGIDEGEEPREALFRELWEEIGTKDVEVIAEFPTWLKYDFPEKIAKRMRPFDGQVQKYFLVRLKNHNIDVNTETPEFCRYEFVNFDTLMGRINHFKKQVYKQVLYYFRDSGYI